MKKLISILLCLIVFISLISADELLQVVAQNSDYDFVVGYALVSDYTAGRVEKKLGDEFLSAGLYYTQYSTSDWRLAVANIQQAARNSGYSTYIADKSHEKIALTGPSSSLLKAKRALGDYMFLD